MFTYQSNTFNAGLLKPRMVTNFIILKDGALYATVKTESEAKEAVEALNQNSDFQWSGYAD